MPPRPSLAALRGYATAAAPKAAGKAPAAAAPAWTSPSAEANAPRIYTERKAFLYDYYTHLMQRSQLVLLFKHENLTVPTSGQLRAAIAKIPVPRPASVPAEQKLEKATLTVTRTGILAPVVRAVRPNADFSPLLDGPTAVITCPSLSPKYVKAMLGAVERVMKAAQKDEDPKKGPVAQRRLPTLPSSPSSTSCAPSSSGCSRRRSASSSASSSRPAVARLSAPSRASRRASRRRRAAPPPPHSHPSWV
jgi:large subunit ribosomal protein L10